MPRLHKLRKAKKFRYNVNRKRLNKKKISTGQIKCLVWEDRKTITSNLKEIGLGWDPNKVIKITNAHDERVRMIKKMHGFIEEDNDSAEPQPIKRPKGFVMEQMEAEANALRESNFRLPKGLIASLSYFLDKHKLNYKAMVMDKKNYDQWTWKQFRAKCRKFMSIPEQFDVYLQSRSLDKNSLDWTEYESDSEI
ncbi:nucleolar protein 16 [Sitodiplosis mosellana]|uniref:nucleolar protein 16 n=1 Tax=Sitodiplosis mosellana TaxID=263140 RepID=UPI002443D2EE|nr:nucleolar protein 16 [Sitodiplosis mosellana]